MKITLQNLRIYVIIVKQNLVEILNQKPMMFFVLDFVLERATKVMEINENLMELIDKYNILLEAIEKEMGQFNFPDEDRPILYQAYIKIKTK